MLVNRYRFRKRANTAPSLSTVAIYFYSTEFPPSPSLPGATDSYWNPHASPCQGPWPLSGGHQSGTGNWFQQSTCSNEESRNYTQHSCHRVWKHYVNNSVCLSIVIKPSSFFFPQETWTLDPRYHTILKYTIFCNVFFNGADFILLSIGNNFRNCIESIEIFTKRATTIRPPPKANALCRN